ncbi:MAG: DUF6305 family protein [Candidatus Izemoplasmatales bacterium]|nr:DUF6305 family protein [Candidatus Izemoplasmatales bacterium]MDD5293097.1 DUF6305 family protein [Candidatus Izemoplasmatales bacterium]
MKRVLMFLLVLAGVFGFVACDNQTTQAPTTIAPTTQAPTTLAPTSVAPTTLAPTTIQPTHTGPTTIAPVTDAPTTLAPTTVPATVAPTTAAPTTASSTPLPAEYSNMIEGRKVYLTTIGQTADIDTVFNIMLNIYGYDQDALEAVVTRNNMLTAASVEAGSLVIIVPGASSKGMGAAGTNQTIELQRASAFSSRAAAGEIDIVVVHTGGSVRRGVESDPLITASSTQAEFLLVVESANFDGFFDDIHTTYDVAVYLYSITAHLLPPFRQMFDK